MKTLTDHLTQYAAYHQNPRNVATHFVGIPLIVLAVTILLARPSWMLGGVAITPAVVLAVLSVVFYLRLDLRFGLVMAAQMAISLWLSQWFAAQSTTVWLVSGIGLFVVGWAIQFLGHYYEGKKPAFVDDLVGLLVGPLFLTAEVAFYLHLRLDVKAEMDRRLGVAPAHAAGATA
ncbi:Mpo1-like protein [Rhodoferax saidenbachensis]|uniref:Membrane protein YGL010W n=1 Tax=Rhodoferax saidenbachensis TaxID=1484693 RepID=A0ABU1ZP93_9BURK|nr:Mpo1-like protein [Rhodoferax saidenbachensis]MDR7307313.1 putative membrane protein YGL010W [Rhodoferax saidenbachensis]